MTSDLKAAAERVREIMHEKGGEGFKAVAKALGADPKELDAIVTETVPRLNGHGTLDGAMMNGLLIGIAASRQGGVDWSLLGRTGMHPTRRGILAYLTENGIGSPNAISQHLDEPLGNVSYHMKQLFDPSNRDKQPSLIYLVKTEPRRGAVEHFYARRDEPVFLKEGEKP